MTTADTCPPRYLTPDSFNLGHTMRYRQPYRRPPERPGLQLGPISKKMLRGTGTLQGRYTIYVVVLGSLLGAFMTEYLRLSYGLTVAIILPLLIVALGSMNRLTRWIEARRNERFQQQMAGTRKDPTER